MRLDRETQLGYTLLETVVAFAVLAGALAGPISLAIRAIYSSTFGKNKIVAINLAQEGIELVRAVRENNIICLTRVPGWQATRNWKTGDDGSPGSTMVDVNQQRVDATDMVSYVCGGNSIKNPNLTVDAGCSFAPLRINNGTYGYISGTPTLFNRCVQIQLVATPETGPGGVIPTTDMLDVTATITWSERGKTRTLSLTERLYNWHNR